jgi:large subunit ribosomal protein L21
VGTPEMTRVGRPWVEGAKVRFEVEEQTKDAKVIVFKKKRRKGYKRKQGFRREITVLRVLGIEG